MRYNADYFVLEIYRKSDTMNLLQLLTLKHKEKIARKMQIINLYKTGLVHWSDLKEEVTKLRRQIG